MARTPELVHEAVRIEKLIPGGQALGTLTNGKKVMLWGALPGETVSEFQVTKNKSHFVEGIATRIDEKSSFRVIPKDVCYLATSPWQILDYDYELQQKVLLVHEMFRQQGIEVTPDFGLIAGEPYYYRNKMEYALYYSHDDQLIHLAFHERGSHRKIPVKQSSLERPEIWQHAQGIIDELNARHADARQFQSLLLRCNQAGAVSGGLIENGKPHPQFPNLQDSLCSEHYIYSYSPNGFFQINLPMYNLVLKEIAKQCADAAKVLDLYAGVGTIGLSVARDKELTLVECDKSAYREMVANVQNISQGNTQIHPVLAKSEEALSYIAPDQVVIVDPPRAGCKSEVITKFLETIPKKIIYLSCNPITQARDVKMLLEKYQIAHFQPYNFFPRTPHIENLICLERKHGIK